MHPQWAADETYGRDTVVAYKGDHWKAMTDTISAEPGSEEAYYLYRLFSDPVHVYRWILWGSGVAIVLHWAVLGFYGFSYALLLSYLSLVYVALRVLWRAHLLVSNART
jgi:hypothetical protein